MALSRKFKALGRIGALFAAAWGGIATLVSVFSGGPLLPSLLTFGVMFGAIGGISGLTTGLLIARAESGWLVEDVSIWRVSLWGFLGGFSPAGLFGILATAFGASASTTVPLLILGGISGAFDSAISGRRRQRQGGGNFRSRRVSRSSRPPDSFYLLLITRRGQVAYS